MTNACAPTVSSSEREADARRPRIVHASTVHDCADVRVFGKECRTLAAAGCDVTLFAGASYASASRERVEDGVRIVPVRRPRSRLRRMTTTTWGLLRPLLAERADVYHLHDAELVPLGLALRLLGRTVVFDSHDDLPAQVLEKEWIPLPLRPWVARASRLLLAVAGRWLSGIVAATPMVAERYAGANVVTVANFPILQEGRPPRPYARRCGRLVYVGGITANRGLSTMVDVARLVHARTGVGLTLVGPVRPPELLTELPADTDVVEHLGTLSPAATRRVLAESRVGLLLYRRSRAHENAMPHKLFDYLAEGLPVVASDFPLWREIVQESGAGLVVPPDDPEVVADAILDILDDPDTAAEMGERGRRAVSDHFSWEAEARSLLALYDDLLPPSARRDADGFEPDTFP